MKTTIAKTIHFILILFLLTSVGCSKEEDTPITSIYWDKQYDYSIEEYIKKYLTNIECLGVYSTNDTAYFAGLKNNHIWVKAIKFDKNNDVSNWNNVLYELNDKGLFDKSFKINMGYGEYVNFNISQFAYRGTSYTNDVNSLHVLNLIDSSIIYNAKTSNLKLVLIQNKDIVKRINNPSQIYSINMWYNNSFHINYNTNSVFYSEKGDSLFVSKININPNNTIYNTPISYEQTIIFTKDNIQRIDLKENIIIWSTNYKSPFNEPANSRYTYSLLEKTSDTWKYKINIVYEDGTKKEYQFKVNINDGVVTIIN